MAMKKKKKRKSSASSEPDDLPQLEEDEQEKDEPKPEPAPTPTPTPAPMPKPTPTPTPPAPLPEPMPDPGESTSKKPFGPSGVNSCVNGVYSREAIYLDDAIMDVLSSDARTAWPDKEYYFYINYPTQVKLYNALSKRFMNQVQDKEYRTVGPVILRQELAELTSGCNWFGDIEEKDEAAKLFWEDAKRIATLAAWMTGFEDPAQWQLFRTGERRTVTRESLGMPDPGVSNLAVDQRVEIIATEGDSFANAEHLVGKVKKLSGPNGESDQFEIEIVGTFNNQDVKPKLTNHHRFKFFTSNNRGSNAYFSKTGPTGIYRVYPVGME